MNLISDTARYGADGFIGTSWSQTDSKVIPAELTTAISLGAALSWSPQNADHMDQFRTIPANLYQTAAYRHAINEPTTTSSSPVTMTQSLTSGEDLIDTLRLPSTVMPDTLRSPLTGPLGCQFQPLTKKGQPAAILVHGNQSETITIPLQGTAEKMAILHTVSRQSFIGSMHEMTKEYKSTIPVRYVLEYADGSTEELPVTFRRQINAWDDSYVASEAWPVLFGTIGNAYHLNIPAMLWTNPHPQKQLKALQMISGNRTGMDVALFAATLLR